MSLRSVFIHGRPGPYPLHALLATVVGAEFVPVDFLLRWHDIPSGRARKYLSWVLCALFFPRLQSYHAILVDSVHFLPLVMRRLGRLRKSQRVAAFLHDETLFFLRANRYSWLTHRALLAALRSHDAVICFGEMQTELARALLDGRGPAIFTVSGGAVDANRLAVFDGVQPSLDERRVLFIGFGPGEWRGWYKGIDLLLDAVSLASRQVPGLSLRVVGEWDPDYVAMLRARSSAGPGSVEFLGNVWERLQLADHLADSSLYVHLGRGDAFGISVLEAMCAGLPPLVSEWTGAREAVLRVDARLVVPCDAEAAAERIVWYFGLPLK